MAKVDKERMVYLNTPLTSLITIADIEKFSRDFVIEKIKKSRVREYLADCLTIIENKNRSVAKIEMNVKTWYIVKKYFADELDIETNLKKVKAGFLGNLWGTQVKLNTKLDDDSYAVVVKA